MYQHGGKAGQASIIGLGQSKANYIEALVIKSWTAAWQ